ncbi:MAG: hypothetical protein GF364_14815 [Candidatus Lokiarchaeota archaeon]|nr:hypothetical protein [Candidatus Lokiarchaeota archaeon]
MAEEEEEAQTIKKDKRLQKEKGRMSASIDPVILQRDKPALREQSGRESAIVEPVILQRKKQTVSKESGRESASIDPVILQTDKPTLEDNPGFMDRLKNFFRRLIGKD